MAHGDDLVFPCGDPSLCCLYPTFPFYVIFGQLVSRSNFCQNSPMALKAQPNQDALLLLGLPSQDHYYSGPLLISRIRLLLLFLLQSFSNSRKNFEVW